MFSALKEKEENGVTLTFHYSSSGDTFKFISADGVDSFPEENVTIGYEDVTMDMKDKLKSDVRFETMCILKFGDSNGFPGKALVTLANRNISGSNTWCRVDETNTLRDGQLLTADMECNIEAPVQNGITYALVGGKISTPGGTIEFPTFTVRGKQYVLNSDA